MSSHLSRQLKLWINIVTFAAILFIIFVARRDIAAAFEKMRHLNLWVLALMIPAQFMSFLSIAKIYSHYFRAVGVRLPMKILLPAAIELNFVNHVFPSGGVSGFSYLTLRLKEEDVSAAKSTLAQLARYILTFTTFIVMLFLAVFLLAAENRASGMVIFIATALTITILFGALVFIYIIGSLTRIKQFARVFARFLNWLGRIFRPNRRRLINEVRIVQTFEELHTDYTSLRKDMKKMRPAFAWSLASNLCEVSLIYIVFVAHGAWVNPGTVIIAYALATISGLIAILPGGLGVYEPVMVAVLSATGVPNALALSATLVARVTTLTLALGSGYVLYHRAVKRYGTADIQR